jgi:hypothetical protein
MSVRRGQRKLLKMHQDTSVDRSERKLLLVRNNAVKSLIIAGKQCSKNEKNSCSISR